MFLPKIWIICRVCLKQQEEMFNIFNDVVVKSIWTLLRDCGGVPVRRNDDLPDKICEQCLRRLCKANTFRIDCQRGHRELVQKLMERNINMYEIDLEEERKYSTDVISISDTINDYPVSSYITKLEPQFYIKQSENSENPADASNENITIENEIRNHNKKQYCVVSKNNTEETIVETTAKTSNRKEPIVLLLKLKNIQHDKNPAETNKTDSPTKLETKKKTETKASNKMYTKITNEKAKLKTRTKTIKAKTKTILKTKLKLKSNSIKNYFTGNANFTCKVCKKKYNNYVLLRHHMYTHDRPHQCQICKKSFSQIQAFLCHKNRHTGKKPYNCRFCNKTYSDISNRNSHERCFICNKEYASLQMVRNHHNRIHLKLLNK
ncbi:zinc finger protein 54-like [Calliphora vicina]|uniref:zinc finger protein 54-like n=1 Tax=Calliphora vicina TaxID=7373 RepID=UPI00325C2FFE